MTKVIATHSGSFHADETLAVFMLRQLEEFKNSELIRTRDMELIDKADIVVDVGAVYDPARLRFDHHQRGFQETFDSSNSIKLSSAGLIYKHFGKRVICSLLAKTENEQEELDFLYVKVYDSLIKMFDGIDNGVNQYPEDIKPAYSDSTSIAARVARLNPQWNQTLTDTKVIENFEKAVELTGIELSATIENLALSFLPARKITESGFDSRFEIHPSGKIILLSQFCPFKTHLNDLEEEKGLKADQLVLYVLFADTSGTWRIQAMPNSPGSFICRKPLPEPWRGLRDDELSAKANVPDCIFIHASGFIGGAKTKDQVLELAVKALEF